MTDGAAPGPQGTQTHLSTANNGTLARRMSLPPTLICSCEGPEVFESVVQSLEAQLANIGAHSVIDSEVRLLYSKNIRAMADELRTQASSGQISWKQAATQASEVRNEVMMSLRAKSTPVGRAMAEAMKKDGKTLNALIGEKTQDLYGKAAEFDSLSNAKKNKVYAAVVDSSGKSRPFVNRAMRITSRAGRSLIVISVAISIYTVATADDKVDAGKREAALVGSSIAGGIAGGALAGLACGPAAPVCVGVGAFVGGALAAFSVDVFW